MKIEIEIDEHTAGALDGLANYSGTLGDNASRKDVINYLIHAVSDGVRRPGAWERQWLCQALGDAWTPVMQPYGDFYERFPRQPLPDWYQKSE